MDLSELKDEDEFDNDELIDWERPSEDVLDFDGGKIGHPKGGGANADQVEETKEIKKEIHPKHPRCIIHVDFDCFYAQVEMIRNPVLKDKPVAVYQKHLLVTSNYVARNLGVKKMSTKAEALKACPELVFINGEDLTPYREYSAKMFNLIKEYSPIVEKVGLDENFVDITAKVDELLATDEKLSVKGHCYGFEKTDLTLESICSQGLEKHCNCGCIKRLAATSLIAHNLRSALYSRLHLTASAGIAHNKVLAKLIGKTHKPNQQTTIFPAFAVKFLSEKKVREIPGIGSHYAKILNEMGVSTVNQLCSKSKEALIERFGAKLGTFMKNISIGIDNTEVNQSDTVLKSISEEESFRKLTDYNEVKRQIELLVKKVLHRLDEEKRVPKTIKLTLRKHFTGNNYSRISRQAPFNPRLLNLRDCSEKTMMIVRMLLSLFDKMVDRSVGFDLAVINVGFANFEEKASSSSISKFFANSVSSDTSSKNLNMNSDDGILKYGASSENSRDSYDTSSATKTPPYKVMPTARKPEISHTSTDYDPFLKASDKSVGTQASTATGNVGFRNDLLNEEFGSKSSLCPEGVDAAVFDELPDDIKQELLSSWKHKNQQKKDHHSPPKKKQKLSKHKDSKNQSILNYFLK